MATHTLNTRIALKYDLLSAWNSSTLILNKGEIAIAEIPQNTLTGTDHKPEHTPPAIAMKVGDGEHRFSELPWVQAVAGDVYDWAKKAVKPSYEANEIVDLTDYVNNIINTTDKIQDTDTYYKVESGNSMVNGKHVFKLSAYKKNGTADTAKDITIDWSDLDTFIQGESARIQTAIETALDALKLEASQITGEGKFVSAVTQEDGQIAVVRSKIVAADITDTIGASQVEGLVQLGQDVDAVELTLSHVDQAVTESNVLMTKAGVQSDIESYVETTLDGLDHATEGSGDYVTNVTQVNGKVTVSKAQLTHDKIGDWKAEVTDKLALKQNNLPFSDNTQPSTTNYVVRKNDIADLAGAMHFEGIVNAIPPTGDYSSGDLVILEGTNKEYVFDGTNWLELGDEGTHATKAALEAVEGRVQTLETTHPQDVATLRGEIATAKGEAISAAQENTETYVSAELSALKHTNSGSGKFVTSVTQANGKVTVTNGAIVLDDLPAIPQSKVTNLTTDLKAINDKLALTDGEVNATNLIATKSTVATAVEALDSGLHAIAKSGNVNDLVQTAGDVLIFNCGSSTTVI